MSEAWTSDGKTATVTGRTPVSWLKKINPIWWFGNDNEPNPPSWYRPTSAYWLRVVMWYLRNPLENFGDYVIGVVDRNYTVYGKSPIMFTTMTDANPSWSGWKWSVIKLGILRLPFISFENGSIIFYAGWQYGGFFGFKLTFKKSSVQAV